MNNKPKKIHRKRRLIETYTKANINKYEIKFGYYIMCYEIIVSALSIE
jgi:hypothetical protein